MSCERYGRVVREVALGARRPSFESHVVACASCRAALESERRLLGRIDAEIRHTLDERPSVAFLSRVRQRIAAERVVGGAPLPRWCVPVVAAFVAALLGGHLARHSEREPPAPLVPTAAVAPLVPPPGFHPEPTPPRGDQVASVGSNAARTRAEPEAPSPPRGPRVLVPAQEREAVRQFVRRLRGRAAPAPVLVSEVELAAQPEPRHAEDLPTLVFLDRRRPLPSAPVPEGPPSSTTLSRS